MSTTARLVLRRVLRLGEMERRAFIQAMTAQKSYSPGRDLLSTGSPAPGVYIILSGFACRYVNLPDDQRQTLSYLLPGDVCDVRACFTQKTDFSMRSLSEVQATTIPRRDLLELTQRFPQLLRELWRLMAIEDGIARQWQLNVGRRSATQRLAHLLCECFARLRAAGFADSNSCALPINQVDIADALALTPVHVNRTLMELRRAGLVVFKRHQLTIPDAQALRAVAGFEPGYLQVDRDSSDPSAAAAESPSAWAPQPSLRSSNGSSSESNGAHHDSVA